VNVRRHRGEPVGETGRGAVTAPVRRAPKRSPVPGILGGLATGALVAVASLLALAPGGSEPVITGTVLLAFGLGWALVAWLTSRYSAQPQAWAAVPAVVLGGSGAALVAFRPGPATLDLLGWLWPPALAILVAWMVVMVRGRLRGGGRWLVAPVIATLLVLAAGGALTTLGVATRPADLPPSGRLVDVGGRSLYLECAGSGSPTVVLQSGLGEASSSWARIAPGVAASTRVCAYDRAGHGRSDEAGPQDGIALAADLVRLLEGAGVAAPYVLVGHSSGGAYLRVFAARHPDAVAGMVLLDAQPADAFSALPDYAAFYDGYRRLATLSPSLARVGLVAPVLGLTGDQSTPAAARGLRDEVLALPAALRQAQALQSIGDRPLVVLSAGSGQQAGWLEAQARLPALSTHGVQRVLEAATHTSLVLGEHAPASTQAILDVVASIRDGTALR
jgi:pimeloyl-ACP methyl ester carboxylesterase